MSNTVIPDNIALPWSGLARRYLGWSVPLNLCWEVLQLPLYTIWQHSGTAEIVFDVMHCTAGDALISGFSLCAAWLLFGSRDRARQRYLALALTTILLGLVYTIYSEWNNTVVTRSWAYSALMPQLGGIGLSPVAQWIVIPAFVFRRLHTAYFSADVHAGQSRSWTQE